jgi:hypothetical protein
MEVSAAHIRGSLPHPNTHHFPRTLRHWTIVIPAYKATMPTKQRVWKLTRSTPSHAGKMWSRRINVPVERATSPMKMMAGLNRAPYLSLSKINVRSPGVRVRPIATLAAETARAVVEAVSAN